MKHLKLYEEFNDKSTTSMDEINDLFLDLIDDDKCVVTGNQYFKTYRFLIPGFGEGFHDMIGKLESWGVKNYIRNHKAQFIYTYDKEMEDFFVGLLDGCAKTISVKHPNRYILWTKDGDKYFAQDLVEQQFYVFHTLWNVFESKYSMKQNEIRIFTEHMIDEHTDLRGYRTAVGRWEISDRYSTGTIIWSE